VRPGARPGPADAAAHQLSRLFLRRRRVRPQTAGADWSRAADWGWRQNILGIGVATKRVQGEPAGQDEVCLTFFVRRKLANRHLTPRERIPRRLRLEALGTTITTDIVPVGGGLTAHSGAVVRPLRAGAEMAHVRGLPGTLGLLVRRRGETPVLGLSCSHVVACSGHNGAASGDPIEQPFSPGSDAGEVVGSLEDFNTLGSVNTEDVGLLKVTTGWEEGFVQGRAEPTDLVSWAADEFPPDTQTALVGATASTPRQGFVLARKTSFVLTGVPFLPGGEALFEGVVVYQTPCNGGDSGAAVLLGGQRTVLGLHLGGSRDDEIGVFQPIGPIFRRHRLELMSGKGVD